MLGQLLLILIILVLILILCLRKNRHRAPNNELNGSSVDRAEANTRDIENHHRSSTEQISQSDKRRKDAANCSLNHRNLEEGDSVRAIQAILAAARDLPTPVNAEDPPAKDESKHRDDVEEGEEENSIVKSWRRVTDSVMNTIVGPPECTICLEPYEAGQTISWPKYSACDHIFHKECIEEWLMKHDDCPLCRTGLIHGMAEP